MQASNYTFIVTDRHLRYQNAYLKEDEFSQSIVAPPLRIGVVRNADGPKRPCPCRRNHGVFVPGEDGIILFAVKVKTKYMLGNGLIYVELGIHSHLLNYYLQEFT